MYLGIGHTGIYINDGIDVPSTFSNGTDVVNGIRFNQFTRFCDMRPPGVIWTNSFFPSAVKSMMTLQDTPHTTETDGYTIVMDKMMPDYLSAALECPAQLKN
jgi:hypothetical protein